jgi:hypothetical protein
MEVFSVPVRDRGSSMIQGVKRGVTDLLLVFTKILRLNIADAE